MNERKIFIRFSLFLDSLSFLAKLRLLQETEVTSTPTRPVDNVVIATKGLQDRNTNIIAGTTVENKGKLIQTHTSIKCGFQTTDGNFSS